MLSISTINDKDYKKFLYHAAEKLSIQNETSVNIEFEQLLSLNVLEIDNSLQKLLCSNYSSNLKFNKSSRLSKNNELESFVDFITNYENYEKGTPDDKNFIIDAWIKILNASRTVYSVTLMSKFKELRKIHNYTQTTVANALGITYQAYAHYEKGRRLPDIDTVVKLARFYKVSLDSILGINAVDSTNFKEHSDFEMALFALGITEKQLSLLAEEQIVLLALTIKQLLKV